jgi:hypothetical protein
LEFVGLCPACKQRMRGSGGSQRAPDTAAAPKPYTLILKGPPTC